MVAGSELEGLRTSLGRRARELRVERGLSARSLATAIGVTPGFVSQLENGHVMPSVATLVRMAAELDVHVGDLFDTPVPTHSVVRAGERRTFEANPGVFDQVISADPSQRLEVLVARIEPGASSGEELYTHGAEVEFVLVTSGELDLRLRDETIHLGEGDAATISGDVPHGYVNRSDAPAHVVWAMTPATY